jgi:glutathione synthase/RimK-type ligase-like ATP-grasp enzyme
MIERLGWVTTAPARGQDEDEPLVLPALRALGVAVDLVDWDDPEVDWARFDRVVIRSTWDYPDRLAEFTAWLERVGAVTEVRNPPPVVRWSLDKHYLSELAGAGVPTVATRFVEPGERVPLPAGPFVVKPAVGAGSRDASSYAPADRALAQEHIARLHARGVTALVQPLLASVATDGEWPLVFLDGEFSHAANKRVTLPRAGAVEGLFAEETSTGHEPDAGQLAVARAAMAVVTGRFGPTTYARVDLVRDDEQRPCVLEVELVEPSLFLFRAPGAAERFAEILVRSSAPA